MVLFVTIHVIFGVMSKHPRKCIRRIHLHKCTNNVNHRYS